MSEPSEALLALASDAELVDVSYELLSAEFLPDSDPVTPEFALSQRLPGPDEQVTVGQARWQYSLRVRVTTSRGTVVVEPVATYAIAAEQARLLQQPTLTEFANEVAVMALLPYARQALQDLAGQVLREQIVMPSFPRGAITFTPPPEPGG